MYIIEPNGGVRPPIWRLSTTMRPKWMGSMPSSFIGSSSSGTRMIIMGAASTNMPAMSRKMFMTMRNTYLF